MSSRALLYCAGGGIGDSLVASVVARALREKFDRVDALTLPGHRETLLRVPDLDGVLIDDGGDERVLAAALRERGYDACVVTWATARTARVPQRAGIPIRVGQARRLYSFRFTHRVAVRSELGDVTSHWSEILLDYARALGCDAADRRYRFVPTPHDDEEAERVVASVAGSAGFLLLNPCNAIASRRGLWPVEGWAALARALHDRFGATIAVSGAPGDVAIVEAAIARARRDAGAPGGFVSVAGKVGIGAFGALARKARGFVGITTGSMHVAAAVGCPTVGVFPFQADYPDRWAPLGPKTAIVRPSYPCHRGDTKESCPDYACVAALDVDRIVTATASLV
ncbi:MAG TPA: glycosyltransferase family 9 protein [Candidatus Acidoferrales bacterium]|nr:glycosyltransferase family 9 protein [Candidatus Acidoferrales bacterium]